MSHEGPAALQAVAEQPAAGPGALAEFARDVRTAVAVPDVAERLAQTTLTAAIRLAEAPQRAVLVRFGADGPEIREIDDEASAAEAEIELTVPGRVLPTLWQRAIPALILEGRVSFRGPVSRLLRVAPLLRPRTDPEPISTPETPAPDRLTPEAAALLDKAAEYRFHRGAPTLAEEHPGDFWSIDCVDVHKSFGGNVVLNGLRLGIPEGMITVVMGPSGTGKSVLIKHLVGLLFPDRGEVFVHGESVSHMRRSQLLDLRKRFGILFQDGALFGSMPLYDNVAFPLRQHTDFSEARIREIVERRLGEVGLSGIETAMPNELSGGMRKRAGFARALVLEPEIVLFDEPDSGLDPVRTALLCALIQKMHEAYGGTYIVITHDVASARQIGEYIAVLWKGRIVEAGAWDKMFASENPFVRQFLNRQAEGPLGME